MELVRGKVCEETKTANQGAKDDNRTEPESQTKHEWFHGDDGEVDLAWFYGWV